ncbi:MAG: cytidylate kinase family protein [Bacteroidales bacterium]|nr:cytidylate kinase family protein [Bacteroidales bacterium]MBO7529528.1 cytidylate kinase family protein [Bacteroidales bacterium]
MNHITLSGELGSGKSTVANYLIGKMPFKIVSAGLLFRQLAAKHGMSAKEFNQFIENDPKYDHYVDDTMAELGRTDEKIIFDSRMAWHFVPSSFKIYLYVDVDTATERIFNDVGRVSESYSDKATARKEIVERRQSEILRYQNFYHCNLDDYSNYDLIVDTSHASRNEVNELVFNSFKAFEEGKEYTKIWLSPKSLILKGDEPDDSGEKLIINKKDGRFVVESGFTKVKKALENRQSLVAVDVVKC